MGVVDFQSGLQGELMRRAVAQFQREKFDEEKRQASAREGMQQQVFASNEELKRAQLDATADARKQATETQRIGQAQSLADQIPSGQFIAENDPAVGMLRTGGRGAMLQPQDERPRVDEGPLMPGDTGAAKAKGFIKTASASQQNVIADNERAAQAESRAAELAKSQAGHQSTMERIAQQNANSTSENRGLQAEIQALKLAGERTKQGDAAKAKETAATNAQQTTQSAVDLLDQLEKHPGFGPAYGNVSSRVAGFSQSAVDAGSIRDQLVNTLALPNLGALKGPMSDKDIMFVKSISTRLGNPLISEAGARKAIAEARTFLRGKQMSQGITVTGDMGNTIRARDAQGVLHEAPAGTALPAGWKQE